MSIAMMGDIDILVPKTILDRRRPVIREACLDYAALVDVLPLPARTMSPSPPARR